MTNDDDDGYRDTRETLVNKLVAVGMSYTAAFNYVHDDLTYYIEELERLAKERYWTQHQKDHERMISSSSRQDEMIKNLSDLNEAYIVENERLRAEIAARTVELLKIVDSTAKLEK